MAALRKDQDASCDIVETWIGMQRLHQQLSKLPRTSERS